MFEGIKTTLSKSLITLRDCLRLWIVWGGEQTSFELTTGLLVLSWFWYPWFWRLSFEMLMILVQWISPGNTARPLYFWCFASNSAFFKWQMSISEAKSTNFCALRPDFMDHLFFYFWPSSGPTPESFPVSHILYPLLFLLREPSWLEA